jgi:hypothetical protein
MAGVDPLGQSLYFQATAAAQQQIAAKKKNETEKTKKTSFKAIFQKVQEETELEADGLPIELAGMDMESAVIFLKDNVDIAGEVLKNSQTPETFGKYKKAVGQFLRYLEKNNFEVVKIQRRGINRRTKKKLDPRVQVKIINMKLDQLASDMLFNHRNNLALLARLEELNGLIIDIIAA